MKNKLNLKTILRIAGTIAFAAIIGFSMAGCDDGNTSGARQSGAPQLTATATSSSEIYLSWTSVSGAARYNVYQSTSSSSGFNYRGSTSNTYSTNYDLPPNTTVYYQVAAVTSDGREGPRSNTASARTLASASLNGNWRRDNGSEVITVNGSSGTITSYTATTNLTQDALNKNYIYIGYTKWKNLTSTGNRAWSGQVMQYQFNKANPNVCTGMVAADCTISMSSDGQTIYLSATDTNGPYTTTYYRQ